MNITSNLRLANYVRRVVSLFGPRSFATTNVSRLKEIHERKEGNKLIIEGVHVQSPREPLLLKANEESGACPMCRSGLDIKHTDVLILSQFLRHDGCMLPRRITGLCRTQQKRIAAMVAMAQKAGLMPNMAPANSKKDPRKRKQWKKWNTYFDENTIKA
ncbi:hypothetical protein J437_LFUL017525 [Ladona fulva]|uniref:Large ribosomal subunit protein mL66 n=1 Tax=Ladona fulva TaxID=123851 RepID=A0A8K0KSD3_LADFU|nr:hypothetical protein J437_LFUL017525 [Ladona fulva]